MINHARTLLLNVPGATSSHAAVGEEYIPPTYAPLQEPSYTQAVRRTLLGTSPDRYFLNFRARELMHNIHQTELAEYVYALDPRVTYWPEVDTPFLGAGSKISIARVAGAGNSRLVVVGQPVADNGRGRALREYDVEVDATNLTVSAVLLRGEPRAAETAPLATVDGMSAPVRAPRSQLSVKVALPETGDRWRLTALARPEPAITTLLPILEILGESVFLGLFGVGNAEPYNTFKNLWLDHPDPAYRLGGLTMALIYRTNDIRNGINV
jgi:hypothetical protein